MLSRTKQQLREGVRRRARIPGVDSYCDDDDIDEYVLDSLESLIADSYRHPEVFQLLGKRFSISGSGPTFSLPADFYGEYMLLHQGQNALPVPRLEPQDIPYAIDVTGQVDLTLLYIPLLDRSTFSSNNSAFEYLSGWNVYVECDVAAQILEEMEEDSSALRAQQSGALERVMMNARRMSRPVYVRDARGIYGRRHFHNTLRTWKYSIEGTNTDRIIRIAEVAPT